MLFKNKYRAETARLRDWDYSFASWYYVTINSKGHKKWFGEVVDDEVILNDAGVIADEEWRRTAEIRKNVELDEYVIMPNHIHGIIIINDNVETTGPVVSIEMLHGKKNETTQRVVSTTLRPNSLGSIIGQFKSVVTKRIRKEIALDFMWQARFYDHIIRNGKSLYAIRKYIRLNPPKWTIDKYYR